MALDQQALEAAREVYEQAFPGAYVTFDGMEAAITAYLAALGDGWRPIDDGAKSGVEMLFGRFTGDPQATEEGRVRVDWWRSRQRGDFYEGPGEFNTTHWPATHYRPLPTPPGEKK